MAKLPHPLLDRFVAEPAQLVQQLAPTQDKAEFRAQLANRLRERLVSWSGWVRHFFTLEEGLLVPIMKIPAVFEQLKD